MELNKTMEIGFSNLFYNDIPKIFPGPIFPVGEPDGKICDSYRKTYALDHLQRPRSDSKSYRYQITKSCKLAWRGRGRSLAIFHIYNKPSPQEVSPRPQKR